MAWRQFVLDLENLDAATVEDVLERHGALAVTLQDAADDPVLEPLPGETPLWQQTSITGLFDEGLVVQALVDDLERELAITRLPPYRIEALEDRVWEREWLRDFRPMRFGSRLMVCPVDAALPDGADVVIRLDPGLAFGTGTHPTTALCLEELDRLDVSGKQVLDFGCGSGILALGALLLGARNAVAYDIDQQAVVASRSNAEKNGVADRLLATTDAAAIGDGFDLVVANILAAPLVELAADISLKLAAGGSLVLSGVLASQGDDVMAHYRRWIRFRKPATKGEWVCLTGTRREG